MFWIMIVNCIGNGLNNRDMRGMIFFFFQIFVLI